VDYEAELILSTLMESHAGGAADAAAAAAAAVGRGERIAIDGAGPGQGGMDGGGLPTPGGIEIESPAGDGRLAGSRSGGSGRPGSGRAGELGLSPAPGLSGRALPGATLARPTSAAAAAAAGEWVALGLRCSVKWLQLLGLVHFSLLGFLSCCTCC
jgi:hypothetical protein